MSSFWSNIFRRSEDDSIQTVMESIPLFEGLSSRELDAVVGILHRREYEVDEVLFRSGDFFGELALLNETPRSATAIARQPSVLFGLFRPDLLGLLERDPALGVDLLLRMSRVISERLIQSNDEVQRLREQLAAVRTPVESSSMS